MNQGKKNAPGQAYTCGTYVVFCFLFYEKKMIRDIILLLGHQLFQMLYLGMSFISY